jgi:hypothetical protein
LVSEDFTGLNFSRVVLATVKVCFRLPFHDVCVLTIPASVFSTGCSCFFWFTLAAWLRQANNFSARFYLLVEFRLLHQVVVF